MRKYLIFRHRSPIGLQFRVAPSETGGFMWRMISQILPRLMYISRRDYILVDTPSINQYIVPTGQGILFLIYYRCVVPTGQGALNHRKLSRIFRGFYPA
jgi:hypothetical protein